MKRLSPVRRTVLEFLRDKDATKGQDMVYIRGLCYDEFERYATPIFDTAPFIWAAKAGHVTLDDGCFASLTSEGLEALEDDEAKD